MDIFLKLRLIKKNKQPVIRLILFILLIYLSSHTLNAQNAGIGDAGAFTPDASSIFELQSTTKGFLMPRMLRAERVAIVAPAHGLMVIQTDNAAGDLPGIWWYSVPDTQWYLLLTASTLSNLNWLLTGNAGLNPATNFMGTTDAVDVVFRTNNTELMRLYSAGNVNMSNSLTVGNLLTVSAGGANIIGNTFITGNTDITGNTNVEGIFSIENPTNFTNSFSTGAAQAANIAYVLPLNQGVVSSLLLNDGSGNLSWIAVEDLDEVEIEVAFDEIESGTNTQATMIVGTGASLTPSGTGVIQANQFVGTGSLTNAVDLATLEVSGILPVPNGGTGIGSVPVNSLLYGNGTSPLNTLASVADSYLTTDGSGNLVWTAINFDNLYWTVTGNAGTSAATNFLGTTDNIDVVFRTNNTERMRVTAVGDVGINNNAPSQGLEITDGNVMLSNTGTASEIMFAEPSASGSNYTSFRAQPQATNIRYVLPDSSGPQYSLLENDGNDNLRWATYINLGFLFLSAPTPIPVTVNGQSITVNSSYIRFEPDANPPSRQITITDGTTAGQILLLSSLSSSPQGVRLFDAGNCNLSGNMDISDDDTLILVWDGGNWIEISRSNN